MKLDATGAFQWAKTVGSTAQESARAIAAMSDGGFVLAGTRIDLDEGAYIMRFSATGDLLWARQFVSSLALDVEAHDVIQAPDGNIIVCGFALGLTSGATVFKLDANGVPIWSQLGASAWIRGHTAVGRTCA